MYLIREWDVMSIAYRVRVYLSLFIHKYPRSAFVSPCTAILSSPQARLSEHLELQNTLKQLENPAHPARMVGWLAG